jgi:hypothetical protein
MTFPIWSDSREKLSLMKTFYGVRKNILLCFCFSRLSCLGIWSLDMGPIPFWWGVYRYLEMDALPVPQVFYFLLETHWMLVIQFRKLVHPEHSVPKVVVILFRSSAKSHLWEFRFTSFSLGGRLGCIMNDRFGTTTRLYCTYIGFGHLGRKIRIHFVDNLGSDRGSGWWAGIQLHSICIIELYFTYLVKIWLTVLTMSCDLCNWHPSSREIYFPLADHPENIRLENLSWIQIETTPSLLLRWINCKR